MLKEEDTEEASVIFNFELSDFDYVDGIYRLKATVYEKNKYTEVISEEAEWVSTELENSALESSEYLKLYPFSQYAENKMFTQNRKNVGKSALIRVLPKGCAVIAKEVGYQEIHHVPCEVLNSDGCQFVDAKDVLTFDFENKKILVDGKEFNGPIIFTGAIDELFDCKLGQLPYRSLEFKFEHYNQEFYQSKGVVNYTVSEDYTRITEFKYLTGQVSDTTTIIKEYPKKYTDPKTQVHYYAILSDVDLVKPFNNFYLLGRLAQYKYYNIDGIVLEALKFIGELL